MIEVSKTQWGLFKANAKASRTFVDKKTKNLETMEKCAQENEELTEQISKIQSYVVATTGHTTEDLMHRVVTATKVAEDGKATKSYDYVPNEDRVHYNEETKMYEILEDADFTENLMFGDEEYVRTNSSNPESEESSFSEND